MNLSRFRHAVALLFALTSTGGTRQATPSVTPLPAAATRIDPPCGARKWVNLLDELPVVVDGIITVEPPADTVLFIPEGDHILNGASLRVRAGVLCVPGKARILAFEELRARTPKEGTPAVPGQSGASEQGYTGGTGTAGDPGGPARLIQLFVTGKVMGGGTLTVINNGMRGGRGQQGGLGGLGGTGERGEDSECFGRGAGTGSPAGRGGKGGTGGTGGTGGNGGTILYNLVVKRAMERGLVSLSAPGGIGGEPGPIGEPGKPGEPGPGGHGSCDHGGGGTGETNVPGLPGDPGAQGQGGQTGELKLVEP